MHSYFRVSRSLTYSLLFSVPLLLAYELGAGYLAASEGSSLRNGADVLLRTLLAAGNLGGTLPLTIVLLVMAAILIFLEQRRRRIALRLSPFIGMTMESVVYALLLGVVIGGLTQWVLHGVSRLPLSIDAAPLASLSFREGVVLSLGAGFYEELVFRVILVGGFFAILRGSGLERRPAAIFSAILAALIFSAFHYVGPYGDPWALPSFLFRFLAGLAFSVLFLVRGFGITAWTHALYDIFIFAVRSS
jgi:membrane protease YdiL (CAAX protease family)